MFTSSSRIGFTRRFASTRAKLSASACVGELGERVLLAPHAQDRGRRAEGVAEVVDGRAAHAAPLQDRDPAVRGLAHAGFLEEARQHLVLALGEVAAGPVRALLEHHHVAARRGQLGRGHRAAGAGADHAHVRARDEISAAREQRLDHAEAPAGGRAAQQGTLVADQAPALGLAVPAQEAEIAQAQESRAAKLQPRGHPGAQRGVLLVGRQAREARRPQLEEQRAPFDQPQRQRQQARDGRVEAAADRVDGRDGARVAHLRRVREAGLDHALHQLGQDLGLGVVEEAISGLLRRAGGRGGQHAQLRERAEGRGRAGQPQEAAAGGGGRQQRARPAGCGSASQSPVRTTAGRLAQSTGRRARGSGAASGAGRRGSSGAGALFSTSTALKVFQKRIGPAWRPGPGPLDQRRQTFPGVGRLELGDRGPAACATAARAASVAAP